MTNIPFLRGLFKCNTEKKKEGGKMLEQKIMILYWGELANQIFIDYCKEKMLAKSKKVKTEVIPEKDFFVCTEDGDIDPIYIGANTRIIFK